MPGAGGVAARMPGRAGAGVDAEGGRGRGDGRGAGHPTPRLGHTDRVDAFYEVLEESEPGGTTQHGRFRSSVHTTGPWAAGLQHAGPPSALLTRSVRRLAGVPDRALPARLAFDIFAPVPVADLVLTAETVRPGRRIALVQASLAAASEPDRPVMSLRAWLVRQLDPAQPIPGIPVIPTSPAPGRLEGSEPMSRPAGWHAGYLDAIDWLWVEGSLEAPGPATVWTRLRLDLVAGESPDPVERLVAVADSASGISAVASPARVLFVNTDLTLHLTRAPLGEEVWLRAETVIDPTGIGRTAGELGDPQGAVARSAQCLFVEPRG